MSLDVQEILHYWRNSLADGQRQSPSLNDRSELFPLSAAQLEAGQLSPETTEQILRAETERLRREKPVRRRQDEVVPAGEDGEAMADEAGILLCPYPLAPRVEHGKKVRPRALVCPLWMAARLDQDGKLRGQEGVLPWFDRAYLEPVAWAPVTFGTVAALDAFLTAAPPPDGGWEALWSRMAGMIEAVHGGPLGAELPPGYWLHGPIALLWDGEQGAGFRLLKLYDRLRGLGENPIAAVPPLLRRLIQGGEGRTAPLATALVGAGVARHLGQMGAGFGLSPSQRRAVHAFLEVGEGALLAIDGPPGTGKTTLLQSLVAALWVEAATAGEAETAVPPLILAVSNNNQAVTNILDTFQKATTAPAAAPSRLVDRWLPGLPSYGLYFPARARQGKSGFPDAVRRPGGRAPFWNGFPETLRDAAFQQRAAAAYLAAAGEFAGQPFDRLEAAVSHLHGGLVAERNRLHGLLQQAALVEELRLAQGATDAAELEALLDRKVSALHQELEAWRAAEDAMKAAFRKTPVLHRLLFFLSTYRRFNYRELTASLKARNLPLPPLPANRWRNPRAFVPEFVWRQQERLEEQIARLQTQREAVRVFREALQPLWEGLPSEHPLRTTQGVDRTEWLAGLLDCTLRHRLFLLAGRYWEGRWLLAEQSLAEGAKETQDGTLRRLAMLMPCFVSTFYMAPAVAPWKPKSADTLDLLIVDEAGQAAPEVAGAVFALATRAVVVGDVHQIEPVWSVSGAVDAGNAGALEVPSSHRAHGGNLMAAAHGATTFTTDAARRAGGEGVFLSEHRRCLPEIIAFCNALAYGGALEPLRSVPPDRPPPPLPPLGYGHVRSPMESRGGSRANPGEARAIARWLAGRRQALEEAYDRPLGEIVGIVTPFRAQTVVLEAALKREAVTGITVGTVHTFQGAERPVILFSPTDSASDRPGGLFFDQTPNMLNVAVSRAQDSFLVFGDLGLFDPGQPQRPSGLLARHLFQHGEELPDVVMAPQLLDVPGVERLASLEAHRAILRRALEESRERVLIVSPWLSSKALEADGLEVRIRAAVERGVMVTVIHDPSFDGRRKKDDDPQKVHRRQEAEHRLTRAGATVHAVNRTHQKTLAVDDQWIVEGSFNWLSAARASDWANAEASLRCGPPRAAEWIEAAWEVFRVGG